MDPRRVAHETIDGEVILIQIETGFYYSLGGSGAEIWDLLGSGYSVDEIADALEGRFGSADGIRAAVTGLAEELHSEGLVEHADDDAAPPSPIADAADAGGVFVRPALERYEDMQDFLLVDPIHEVEDTGWPHKKLG